MIHLGLERAAKLLRHMPQPWKVIHVAGTNGKGTICAYLSAMLHASGVRCGRFTSPHLIDRWDCISVNEEAVSESVFRDAEAAVRSRDAAEQIGASEFELLAATAFEIFTREKVEMGIVEVGMGGRLDATNVIGNKAVTVISKIGLDHQGFLGDTVEAIAREKAGIMRPGVPCVVDSTNLPSVKEVIQNHAQAIGAKVAFTSPESHVPKDLSVAHLAPSQRQNLACALTAFRLVYPEQAATNPNIIQAIQQLQWPGRLQTVDLTAITGQTQLALLDGAHNEQSAEVLGSYVDQKLRPSLGRVTWVLAASHGKDLAALLRPLVRPEDYVTAVAFGPVDGMPWVKATAPENILEIAAAKELPSDHLYNAGSDVLSALKWATEVTAGGTFVIAGSLYLMSDVLRLLRAAK
jgi:folylpolyglutamate synthase/dihydrofolate synthase